MPNVLKLILDVLQLTSNVLKYMLHMQKFITCTIEFNHYDINDVVVVSMIIFIK